MRWPCARLVRLTARRLAILALAALQLSLYLGNAWPMIVIKITGICFDGVRRKTALHLKSAQVSRNSRVELAPEAHTLMVAGIVLEVNDSPDPFLTSSVDPVTTPEV